jgi:hypothetical protein
VQLPDPLPARLTAIRLVFPAIALIALANAWASFDDALLYGRDDATDDEYLAAQDRADLLYYLGLASYLAGAIAFLRWLRPTYRYIDAVAPGARRFKPDWAILGWFVPVMWWWRPKQVINDVWRAGGHSTADPVLLVWWALWVASSFHALTANVATDDARAYSFAWAAFGVADAICALLAIAVATRATRKLQAP